MSLNIAEIFSFMKKIIMFSRHCEGALFSQGPRLDLRYLRLSVNLYTVRSPLFWHITQCTLAFSDVPEQSINNPSHLQETSTP